MKLLCIALLAVFITVSSFAIRPLIIGPNTAFSPLSLTPTLWLDAATGAYINAGSPSDNDAVSTWHDASGNGKDFIESLLVLDPAWHTNKLNSKACVTFASTTVLKNDSTQFIGTGSTGFTIYAVLEMDTRNTYNLIAGFLAGGSGNDPQFGFSSNGGDSNLFFEAKLSGGTFGAVRATTSFSSTSTYYGVAMVYNGGGPGSGNYAFYDSNVLQTTAAANDNTNTLSTNLLGAANTAGFASLTGNLCELFIQPAAASAGNLSDVQAYWHTKWGL